MKYIYIGIFLFTTLQFSRSTKILHNFKLSAVAMPQSNNINVYILELIYIVTVQRIERSFPIICIQVSSQSLFLRHFKCFHSTLNAK